MENISQNRNTDTRQQNMNLNQNFFNTIVSYVLIQKNIQETEMKKQNNNNYDSNNKYSTNVFSPQNNNIFSPPNIGKRLY